MASPGWPYNSFNRFLYAKFGTNVRRLPLDLGYGCPHRQKNPPGCHFCQDEAIRPSYIVPEINLREQLARGAEKFSQAAFMPYLQSGVNTAGDPDKLKRIYEFCLSFPQTVGLIIATRPDYISREIIDIFKAINQKTFLVVELGLQSSHDKTLLAINRGHSYECFVKSATMLREAGIYQAVHLILGLPGEDEAMMKESVLRVCSLGVNAIKFHHLQVLVNTPLAALWQQGQLALLREESYPPLIVDLLEQIPWEVHIMRLVTNTNSNARLAPNWHLTKDQMLMAIQNEFKKRASYQGLARQNH